MVLVLVLVLVGVGEIDYGPRRHHHRSMMWSRGRRTRRRRIPRRKGAASDGDVERRSDGKRGQPQPPPRRPYPWERDVGIIGILGIIGIIGRCIRISIIGIGVGWTFFHHVIYRV